MTLTVYTDKTMYMFGELVQIFGSLQELGDTPIEGASIAIEVKDPRNNTIFLDIAYSQSDGTYEDSFRLPSNSTTGECHVFTTAHKTGYVTATAHASFFVKIPGDVDGDGDVDYDDFIVLAGAYGSSSGQPAYDERADFDGDGDVDYDDFILLAGNYGKTV